MPMVLLQNSYATTTARHIRDVDRKLLMYDAYLFASAVSTVVYFHVQVGCVSLSYALHLISLTIATSVSLPSATGRNHASL